MSQAIELQLTCPQCGTEFESTGQTLVDMGNEADSEVLWQLQNGTLNKVECPNCHVEATIPIPVVTHVPAQQMVLVYVPGVQGIDEEQLGQLIGPLLQEFISNIPEDQQSEYMLRPVVTDDLQAIQMAANGELTAEDLMEAAGYMDEGEGDEEDGMVPAFGEEEQAAVQGRMQLIQNLFSEPDSLQRISLMRGSADLVDDLYLEVLGAIADQAEEGQPELVPTLRKMMNEAEVFISTNRPN